MNLDLLISKYIDGELTSIEEEQLRSLLSNNANAKETFDSYIDFHIAMSKDANSIILPPSLKRATEDRVMMAIMNESPKIIPIKKKYNLYYKVASIAIFLLFAFYINTNDHFFNFSDIYTSTDVPNNSSNNISDKLTNNTKLINNAKNNNRKPIINKAIDKNSALISDQRTNNISIATTDNLITKMEINKVDNLHNNNLSIKEIDVKLDDVQNINNTIAKDIDVDSYTPNKIEIIQSQMQRPFMNANFEGNNIYSNSTNEINLTTYMSFDFIRNGINTYENTAIQNFSQSISYSINNESRVGLEFGLSEFDYQNIHYIKVKSTIDNYTTQSIEVLDPTSNNAILIPIQVKENKKNYWGTIFYERNLLNYGNLSLDGRIGVGSNTDGMIGLTRLVAKYNIISGLYASAGAEGRMFDYKLPLKNISGLATNISFVWGLYFQF